VVPAGRLHYGDLVWARIASVGLALTLAVATSGTGVVYLCTMQGQATRGPCCCATTLGSGPAEATIKGPPCCSVQPAGADLPAGLSHDSAPLIDAPAVAISAFAVEPPRKENEQPVVALARGPPRSPSTPLFLTHRALLL
jgi:hypothetical protein